MNQKQNTVIAIDGYSACGKSTLAKALAKELNYTYVDSGAMYRAVTLYAIRKGIDEQNSRDIIPFLKDIVIDFKRGESGQELYLNGENVEKYIRSMEVANKVSYFAKVKEVRSFLVDLQRQFALKSSIVMDGRDIGSVVFPNADLKIFMTAKPAIRAERRYAELCVKNPKISREEVLENLIQRDTIDENRKESPLIKDANAFIIDNSYLTHNEQLMLALQKIKEIN